MVAGLKIETDIRPQIIFTKQYLYYLSILESEIIKDTENHCVVSALYGIEKIK